jgi:hypothetical protein
MSEKIRFTDESSLLEHVLHRSATDGSFRERLLRTPREAVGEVLDVPGGLPADLRLGFIEKDKDVDALIVLPDFFEAEAELSDRELAAVAGGCWVTSCWLSIDITFCGGTDNNTVKVDSCN